MNASFETMMDQHAVIEVKKISRVFKTGEVEVQALHAVDLTVKEGEFVAVMGASGSGKSTFLHILGCLDKPSSGEYYLDGVYVNDLDDNALADIRNQKIGFIFQSFNLLPRQTAIENVELPLIYDRSERHKHPEEIAQQALERVGLGDRLTHKPSEMSGGQQQRVAIARALVNDPAIILADEATGNLDSKSGLDIADLFVRLNDQGKTILMITHEPDIARFAKRIITFRDGTIVSDEMVKNRNSKAAALSALDQF